jgi:hypothetical protein
LQYVKNQYGYTGAANSMSNYMRAISGGTVSFNPADNIILGPTTVPCNGTSNGIPFNSKMCDSQAVWVWQQAADKIAQQVGDGDCNAEELNHSGR